MNTTIILTSLIALITGLIGGVTYTKNTLPEMTESPHTLISTESLVAEDFISVRPALQKTPASPLSDAEKADLIFMREEEKLARDVYQTLYDKWGLPSFSNIAQSEQTHTEAVRDLLIKYDIADPVTNDAVGVFVNPDLQTLYTSLTQTGLVSIEDALKVGALIEELDIKDIAEALSRTDNVDIRLVYENLLRGSRNHLRAFNRQLSSRGVTYQPLHISTEEYQSIVANETETDTQGEGRQMRGWGNR